MPDPPPCEVTDLKRSPGPTQEKSAFGEGHVVNDEGIAGWLLMPPGQFGGFFFCGYQRQDVAPWACTSGDPLHRRDAMDLNTGGGSGAMHNLLCGVDGARDGAGPPPHSAGHPMIPSPAPPPQTQRTAEPNEHPPP